MRYLPDQLSLPWRVLRAVAIGLGVIYLLWHGIWLAAGQIPPSWFHALTGLPSPTSGGTRSVMALLDGQWAASLHWHPLALPLLALLAATLTILTIQVAARRPLRLPTWCAAAWAVLLIAAWIVKFITGPSTW